jgi:hypothetical protein
MQNELLPEVIAEIEANLRISPWERMLKNDELLNKRRAIEAFVEKQSRAKKYISK